MLPVFTSRHIVAFFFSYLCNLFLEDVVLSKRKLPLKFYNLSPPVLFRYNCHMVLYKFKIWRKITYIHCKMITTILLVIIHHLVLIQNKERNFFSPLWCELLQQLSNIPYSSVNHHHHVVYTAFQCWFLLEVCTFEHLHPVLSLLTPCFWQPQIWFLLQWGFPPPSVSHSFLAFNFLNFLFLFFFPSFFFFWFPSLSLSNLSYMW